MWGFIYFPLYQIFLQSIYTGKHNNGYGTCLIPALKSLVVFNFEYLLLSKYAVSEVACVQSELGNADTSKAFFQYESLRAYEGYYYWHNEKSITGKNTAFLQCEYACGLWDECFAETVLGIYGI